MMLAGPTAYAVNTTKAIQFLESQDHNDVIPYATLDREMGFDVRKHRHNLAAARRYMIRAHGRHFIILPSVGIKGAEPTETAAHIDGGRLSIGRKARRLVKTAATVDASNMDGTEIQSFAANVYLLHHMGKDAHHASYKRITAKLGNELKELPTADQIAKMMASDDTA